MNFRFPVLSLVLSAGALAADGDRAVVHMEIKQGIPAFSLQAVDFGAPGTPEYVSAPGTARIGKAATLTFELKPVDGKKETYLLTIRGSSGEPVTATLSSAELLHVNIPRTFGTLPYIIRLETNEGPNKSPGETVAIQAEYRAEGALQSGSCQALLAVYDMSADGVFNRRDFTRGSAVGVDINGDGKIGGQGEYLTGGEIFRFCGKSFYVDPDSMESNGSAVTLVETSAMPARLGDPLPTIMLTTADDQAIHSDSWKGKVTLLDFWASWCVYCIEGFPILTEMQRTFAPDLQIISINTDEPSALEAARKTMREHPLPWLSVVSGQGLKDPAWMMFGASEAMPLYVLADRKGVIRYTGSGGDRLADLRAGIQKLMAEPAK